jgi:exopolysaccharide production protein ExoQ
MLTAPTRQARGIKPAQFFDKCMIVPILAVSYCLIIAPLLMFLFPSPNITAPRIENKLFWPALTTVALICFALRNRSRLNWPPHIIWLTAYCALAGASILWAFKPAISFSRFISEMMLLICIIPPALVASRTTDMMRAVFFLCALASVVNAVLILGGYSQESMADGGKIGYPGYFSFKGELGEFAAFAIFFSVYQIFERSWRRALGLIIVVIDIYLMVASESKGAFGFVILAAILSTIVLFVGRQLRVSPLIVVLPVAGCYLALAQIIGNLGNRISWYAFGNYTFTGRTFIWDVVHIEIEKSPLLGWGYRSIWLVGPDSPVLADAWGWIRKMPSAHNGYLDTILDTGYIGLVLFIVFIGATLHAIGRVVDRDRGRAWLLLSISLFIILINFLETGWMRGDALWFMFVLVVAEAGRYWQPLERRLRAAGPTRMKPAIAVPRDPVALHRGIHSLQQRTAPCRASP